MADMGPGLHRDDQSGEATVESVRLVPSGVLLLALPLGLALMLAARPRHPALQKI
jgi:hypothetical protein